MLGIVPLKTQYPQVAVDPDGTIPAVSATGLGVMLLFIIAAGRFVFSRMKRQAA